MGKPMRIICLAGLVALAGHVNGAALAQSDEKSEAAFFKGKTIQMVIGYSAGGGYDVYARLVARFMGKHIPGEPEIAPVNMPGAGSLRAAAWIYNLAPKDGTAIGAVARGVPFDPLLTPGTDQFDATKMNWLGSANNEVSVCVAWHTTGLHSIADLKEKELTVGGTGGAGDTDQFPKVMNALLGTKMRVIAGYPGGNDINLAMERGEVGGRCGWSWSSVVTTQPDWIKDKKINVLVQLALKKHAELPNTPLVTDLAKTDEQRKILQLIFARQTLGRPFVAPPGLPASRVATLRKAFMETMRDPDLLAEAKKAKLEIDPVDGEEVQKLVDDAYATPADIVKKASEISRQ
jgi:tripartite-type tricarboxylate transporter receptor subunit TctC